MGAKVIEHNAMLVSQANDGNEVSAIGDLFGQLNRARQRSRFYREYPNRTFELSRVFLVNGNQKEVEEGIRNG